MHASQYSTYIYKDFYEKRYKKKYKKKDIQEIQFI